MPKEKIYYGQTVIIIPRHKMSNCKLFGEMLRTIVERTLGMCILMDALRNSYAIMTGIPM